MRWNALKWICEPTIKVQTDAYTLELLGDRPAAKVWDAQGRLMAELFLLSSCHTLGGRDVSSRVTPWRAEETSYFPARRIRCFGPKKPS